MSSRNAGLDPVALERAVLRATGARAMNLGERIQSLWSGYGEIRRVELIGGPVDSLIVKYAAPPNPVPRSTAGARSHRRKVRSYQVECSFYRAYAARCGAVCRVPTPFYTQVERDRALIVLEDLDAAGFGMRRTRVSTTEINACLRWLAAFHGTFLGAHPASLWEVGTYWHLATRPDELLALGDSPLRRAAPLLDEKLNRARHRTIVHGDAKLQNFCFSAHAEAVAAVDFQYVGGGVGVKDVAYFLSSCLRPGDLERAAGQHLDTYFRELRLALRTRERNGAPVTCDVEAVESEWRELYPIACADFFRFLLGWAREGDAYLEGLTRSVLNEL